MRRTSVALAFLLFTMAIPVSRAATIEYELFRRNGDALELLASGTRKYDASDFQLAPDNRAGRLYGYLKRLPIAKGFAVAILDTRDGHGGFGITLERMPPEDAGFSWEWYDPVAPGQFVKLQGGGRIAAKFAAPQPPAELSSIEFLDIADLRNKDAGLAGAFGFGEAFVLRIKPGSVLEFPPMAPGNQ